MIRVRVRVRIRVGLRVRVRMTVPVYSLHELSHQGRKLLSLA
jgi:hypothetical protein